MNTITIAAAIIAGQPSLADIALILDAVEQTTARYGASPGTIGFDIRFYVEQARLEAEYHVRAERSAA